MKRKYGGAISGCSSSSEVQVIEKIHISKLFGNNVVPDVPVPKTLPLKEGQNFVQPKR